jgi:hypothetical protein
MEIDRAERSGTNVNIKMENAQKIMNSSDLRTDPLYIALKVCFSLGLLSFTESFKDPDSKEFKTVVKFISTHPYFTATERKTCSGLEELTKSEKTVDTQRTNQVLNLWNRNFVQTWLKSRIHPIKKEHTNTQGKPVCCNLGSNSLLSQCF